MWAPQGMRPPSRCGGTEGVGEFMLRRELMTYRVATDVSYKEVAANLTW